MLLVAGAVHFLPVAGVLGAEQLQKIYGVPFDDANLEILMRHRAALFGLLGLFMVYAAFRPTLQVLALAAGLVSVTSFLWIATTVSGYNAAIRRVFMADLVALACLLLAIAAWIFQRYQRP
ncbi:MAG: hypothetical protein ABL931_04085 [Usitatibacteraceae bacterium]